MQDAHNLMFFSVDFARISRLGFQAYKSSKWRSSRNFNSVGTSLNEETGRMAFVENEFVDETFAAY